jgi:hypothetical protein
MKLKSTQNRVQKFTSFVYAKVRWAGSIEAPTLEGEASEGANGRPACSGCACPRPSDDRLPTPRFEFVPLWVGHPDVSGISSAPGGWAARTAGCQAMRVARHLAFSRMALESVGH